MAIVGLNFRKLCTPAFVYLVISTITLLIMMYQNYNNVDVYCLGDYQCNTQSTFMIFAIKIIYVLFWTWILNIICYSGATGVAWFLVLIPYILLFIMLFLFLFM